jgi:aminoglycoside phosphotransferase family enzyme/predicted kinase
LNEHIERLIRALSNPSVYPHHPDSVQVVQTHISIVFLSGVYVYKVKKPLSLGFLDFTTLEKRKFFCHQEVTLNSRFSRDIYIGVTTIYESASEVINLCGDGQEIEYAVLMKIIPEDKILKNALALNLVDEPIMDKVAAAIRSYHSQAPSGPQISVFGTPEVITQNVRENFYQTEDFIGKTISSETFEFIKTQSFSFMEKYRKILEERIKGENIRDCHGDLHLDHVVLFDQIMLVDCIEFNDRFRYSDCLSDIAFLLMDLDFSGYPAFSNRVLSQYLLGCSDDKAHNLLRFYKVYRAYVRGKVQSFTLNEPEIDTKGKMRAASIASNYFKLARAYFEPPPEPTLVIMCGLMGSGKSFLASKLAMRLGVQIIRSDVVRKESFGLAHLEHRLDSYGEGIYTRESSEKIYQTMLDEAILRLTRRENVIIDASFGKRVNRMGAMNLAKEHGARFLLILCDAPDDIIHSRLEVRMKQTKDPSDGRWELFEQQKTDFEIIDLEEKYKYVKYVPDIDISEFLTRITRQISFGIEIDQI